MEAMIFAAGIGSRLKPFTLSHPKALASVAGVPALQRCVERLRYEGGVEHIVINIHHFPGQIRQFIRDNDGFGLDVDFADESGLLLDTGGGLLGAAAMFHTPDAVLLHNADIVTDFPVKDMVACFSETESDAMLLVNPLRSSSRMLWFSAEDSRLLGWRNEKTGEVKPEGFCPDPDNMYPAAFNGVHIVRLDRILPKLRRYAEIHGPVFSLTPFYLWAISEGAGIRAFIPGKAYRWHDIGTPEKLAAATKDFSQDESL